jgi:hypothetical protein
LFGRREAALSTHADEALDLAQPRVRAREDRSQLRHIDEPRRAHGGPDGLFARVGGGAREERACEDQGRLRDAEPPREEPLTDHLQPHHLPTARGVLPLHEHSQRSAVSAWVRIAHLH